MRSILVCMLFAMFFFSLVNAEVTSLGNGGYALTVDRDIHTGCMKFVSSTAPLTNPKVDQCSPTQYAAGLYCTCQLSFTYYLKGIRSINANLSEKGLLTVGPPTQATGVSFKLNGYKFSIYGYEARGEVLTSVMLKLDDTDTAVQTFGMGTGTMFAVSSSDICRETTQDTLNTSGGSFSVTRFDFCIFYPDLALNLTSTVPTAVTDKDEIHIEGNLFNPSQIDAKSVTLTLESNDFRAEPRSFTFDVSGNYDPSESSKRFDFKLTPTTSDLENKKLNGVYFGKLKYSFTDDTGIARVKELDLGKATFTVAQPTPSSSPVAPPSGPTSPPASPPSTEPSNESSGSNLPTLLIVAVIVVVALALVLVLVGIFYFKVMKKNSK